MSNFDAMRETAMQRRSLLKYMSMFTGGAVYSLSFPSLRAAIASQGKVEWGYGEENGPQLWGELSPDFGVCKAGQQQSPVDLQGAIPAKLPDLKISYQECPLRIINNGHTIQINIAPGNRLTLAGQDFELLQFHFHHPSEHALKGQRYLMEAHFVHRNEGGELVVLGALMQEGKRNETLQPILESMPAVAGPEHTIAGVNVNMIQLLPVDQSAYQYFGSLTTPPCSELVRWIVFQQPIEVSKEQAEKFAKVFPWNARPLQPLNRRFLLESL